MPYFRNDHPSRCRLGCATTRRRRERRSRTTVVCLGWRSTGIQPQWKRSTGSKTRESPSRCWRSKRSWLIRRARRHAKRSWPGSRRWRSSPGRDRRSRRSSRPRAPTRREPTGWRAATVLSAQGQDGQRRERTDRASETFSAKCTPIKPLPCGCDRSGRRRRCGTSPASELIRQVEAGETIEDHRPGTTGRHALRDEPIEPHPSPRTATSGDFD